MTREARRQALCLSGAGCVTLGASLSLSGSGLSTCKGREDQSSSLSCLSCLWHPACLPAPLAVLQVHTEPPVSCSTRLVICDMSRPWAGSACPPCEVLACVVSGSAVREHLPPDPCCRSERRGYSWVGGRGLVSPVPGWLWPEMPQFFTPAVWRRPLALSEPARQKSALWTVWSWSCLGRESPSHLTWWVPQGCPGHCWWLTSVCPTASATQCCSRA